MPRTQRLGATQPVWWGCEMASLNQKTRRNASRQGSSCAGLFSRRDELREAPLTPHQSSHPHVVPDKGRVRPAPLGTPRQVVPQESGTLLVFQQVLRHSTVPVRAVHLLECYMHTRLEGNIPAQVERIFAAPRRKRASMQNIGDVFESGARIVAFSAPPIWAGMSNVEGCKFKQFRGQHHAEHHSAA